MPYYTKDRDSSRDWETLQAEVSLENLSEMLNYVQISLTNTDKLGYVYDYPRTWNLKYRFLFIYFFLNAQETT